MRCSATVRDIGPPGGGAVGQGGAPEPQDCRVYRLVWFIQTGQAESLGRAFALTKFLTATVIFVDAGLVLIALGAFGSIDAVTKLGAACLVISALLALYIGLAQMWNLTFGRTVLPLYPWKS